MTEERDNVCEREREMTLFLNSVLIKNRYWNIFQLNIFLKLSTASHLRAKIQQLRPASMNTQFPHEVLSILYGILAFLLEVFGC